MMKNFFVLFLSFTLFLLLVSSNAYSMRFPVDASIGYGTTYGGAGGKLTLGQILFGGIGKFSGETMSCVGIQVPLHFSSESKFENTPYIGASYGGFGVQESTYGTENEKKVIMGFSVFAGYAWGWDSGLFIHLDGGVSRGKVTWFENTSFEEKETITTIALDFGIGFRFF